VIERPIPLPGLPSPLDGFTLVQITDLHAGPFMREKDIQGYVRRANALRPDLVVLTGDLVHSSPRFIDPCVRALSDLRARLGVFACLGNHEYWVGVEAVRSALEGAGILLLVNEGRVLRVGGYPLNLAALDDLRFGRPNFELALSGLEPGAPTLLLSHRPEVFPEAARRGVGLTLAGHYHGGQIQFRVLGLSITPARLFTPYVEGLFRLGGSLLYVSRGLGTTGTPVRIGARPELTVIRLRSPRP
jgi:predicted MPP superfamily phosphohydrolase